MTQLSETSIELQSDWRSRIINCWLNELPGTGYLCTCGEYLETSSFASESHWWRTALACGFKLGLKHNSLLKSNCHHIINPQLTCSRSTVVLRHSRTPEWVILHLRSLSRCADHLLVYYVLPNIAGTRREQCISRRQAFVDFSQLQLINQIQTLTLGQSF